MARLAAARWSPTLVLAILVVHGVLGQAVPKRFPVPAADAQAKAEKIIRDLFKDDYAKKKPADILALSAKLLDQAKETKDDAVYGKYLCLRKGDWDKGLPFLLEGNDAMLKELSVKELRSPTEPADQIDLAEGWLAYGGKQAEPDKTILLMRAYHWFRQARPKVTGLTKTKVDKAMASSPRHYLTDLDEFDVKLGPWKLGKGNIGNPDGTPITVHGKRSPLSLCLHCPENDYSAVKYRLGKTARTFQVWVGIDEAVGGPQTPVTFTVLGDGKSLWTSQPVKVSGSWQSYSISVVGVEVLELRAHCPGRPGGLTPSGSSRR